MDEGAIVDMSHNYKSNQMSKQNSGSYSNLFNVDTCTTEIEVCSEVTRDVKPLDCENMYSNVPGVTFMQGGDNKLRDCKTNDTNLHLYSNIPVGIALNKETNLDDLDLDPVEMTTNMVKVQANKIAKGTTHCAEYYKNNLNIKGGSNKVSSGDDIKNSIMKFENSNSNQPNDSISNDSVLSASRLQLLQDTTMIDTALDLDSLDGSSIGNSSQVGLVKIVN